MPRSPTERLVRIAIGFAAVALLAFVGWSLIPFILLLGAAGSLREPEAPLLPLFSLAPIPLAVVFYAVGARAARFGWIVHLAGLLAIPILQILVLVWTAPAMPSGEEAAPGEGLILLPGIGVLVASLLFYGLVVAALWWNRRRTDGLTPLRGAPPSARSAPPTSV